MLAWVRTAKSWFCLAPATLHMSNHSTSRVRSHGLSFTVARWSRSMDCRLRCVVKNTRTAMSWSSLPVVAGTLVSTRSTCSATTDVFALIENKERFIICSKFVVATIAGVLFAATICSCQTSENMQYLQYFFFGCPPLGRVSACARALCCPFPRGLHVATQQNAVRFSKMLSRKNIL